MTSGSLVSPCCPELGSHVPLRRIASVMEEQKKRETMFFSFYPISYYRETSFKMLSSVQIDKNRKQTWSILKKEETIALASGLRESAKFIL